MKKDNNEKDDIKKGNKIVVRLLILFIAGLITASFILREPRYEITVSIITCLALLVILALSDVFDNLSIPQVLELSKVKKENEGLKETNQKLIDQVINIKNTNNQKVYVQLNASNNKEDNDNKNGEEDFPVLVNPSGRRTKKIFDQSNGIEGKINYRKNIEKLLLKRVLSSDSYEENIRDIKYNVELVTIKSEPQFRETVRFDALTTSLDENIFYEIKTSSIINEMTINRIRTMLESIKSYMEINKVMCKLMIVIPKYDDKLEKALSLDGEPDDTPFRDNINKLLNNTSIYKNDVSLEIKEIPITKKALDEFIKENNN